MRSRSALARVFALAALALTPALSRADTIDFTGISTQTSGISYSGVMTVDATSTSATISISLTNTSTGAVGPYANITGFGLGYLPAGMNVTSATGSSTDSNFHFLQATTPGVQISLQGGNFEYAFSTDASQLHTVPQSEVGTGLTQGQSATFTVNLTGTGLGTLTAQEVLQAVSKSPNIPFDVRFRSTDLQVYRGQYYNGTLSHGVYEAGTTDGDKVPYSTFSSPPPPPHGVPAPPGVLLGLIGAGCMLGRSFRQKFAAKVA
ncbi:MAG TPA: hypothetical protein VGL71_02380 [Urbifossiella sp.]